MRTIKMPCFVFAVHKHHSYHVCFSRSWWLTNHRTIYYAITISCSTGTPGDINTYNEA